MEETGVRVSSGMTAGRLEGLSVPDLLWELCRRCTTGVLELRRKGVRKTVYVKDGKIVFAASSDPNDRLGELLLRDGLVTLDQLQNAISRLGSGKRLGTLLVEAGHLTSDNLVRSVVLQVRDIVLGLFGWEEGEYTFKEGPLPSDEVITLRMPTGEILLQGIAGIRSFARIRRSVGPPRTMYRLRQNPDVGQEIQAVTLSEGAVLLLGRLERGPESVEALCREVFLSNFEIYQTLWAFKVLGVIEEVEPKVQATGFAVEGRLAPPDGLAGVLVSLCRARETGVVHVVRGTRERAFHLKDGACIFATSNDIDDGLVAHLLRRGVISLRDREEVAKHLLSNKRVGTILLEMGVLDEGDLRAMVCEQLGEIVFDTIRWDEGEFVFVPGDLPTIEEITLTDSIEDLVAAGLCRVTAWSRVQEGCGGADAVLALAPEYLAVLDRMRLGTDAWDVASALTQARSVREVCRATQLSSFRACQILWTLRLLGAVGFATAEDRAQAEAGASDTAVASAAQAFSLGPQADKDAVVEAAPIAVAEPPEEAVLQIAAEATRWIPDAAEENRVLPLATGDTATEVLHDLWRLAAEQAPDRPPRVAEEAPAEEPPEEVALQEVPPEEAPAEVPSVFEEEETPERVEEPAPEAEPAPLEAEAVVGPAETPEVPCEPTAGALAFGEAEEVRPLQDPAATMQLARHEVEAALAPPPQVAEPDLAAFDQARPQESDAQAAPAVEEPAPAPELSLLDADIARFNARQRLLYRSIRAEVGAGAANFVRSCRTDLFAGAELASDGTWDVELLRRTLSERARAEAAPEAFDRLLEAQIDRLTQHIGRSRAEALREQMRKL